MGSSVVLFLLQLCIAWSGLVKKLDALALVIGRSVYGNAETDKLAVAAGNQVILVALAITDAMMHQGGESLFSTGTAAHSALGRRSRCQTSLRIRKSASWSGLRRRRSRKTRVSCTACWGRSW